MTDQSIFNNDDQNSQSDGGQGNDDKPAADQLLGAIVNADGKQKYATVEEALKGAASAQEHISRLETENTTFKQESEKSTTLQSVLDALKPQAGGEDPNKDVAPQLDADTLSQLLEGVVSKRETVSTQKQNTTTVASKFKELHGGEAEAKYYEAAASEGFSREQINGLAASNPSAVFKLLGVDAKKDTPAGSLKGDVNAGDFEKKAEELPRFNPMGGGNNPQLEAFRKSKAATNKRLGIE